MTIPAAPSSTDWNAMDNESFRAMVRTFFEEIMAVLRAG